MRKILLFSFIFIIQKSFAQTDTAFWFAAPDISSDFGYDRPIAFRISSFQLACIVTVSQPANSGFVPQTITLAPFSTQTVDLTSQINNIECAPGNAIQNRGLKITSNNKIASYYEVNVNGPNPELFALKGRNALGLSFYISSQNILDNASEYNPPALSSFNIIASEDNTSVTITPTKNIVGHLANIPFTIVLNKGQTYAAIATSRLANQHLDGSYVSSTKPIAITLADDLLNGGVFGSTCRDLAGDQTIPINVLGSQYIAIKSNLNSPNDKLFITAVTNNTTVSQDGNLVTTINAGQSITLTVSNQSTYIETSLPAYVYQLAGAGCEVGAAILPKIDCTGSGSVSVARSSNEDLYITLLVKNGGQGNFLINNNVGIITNSQFSIVPATGGQWYFAKILLPLSSYPNGSIIKIDNTTNLFQMGFLQGNSLGLSFGYFSDFNTVKATVSASNNRPCIGTNLTLSAETIPSATYNWTGPNGYTSSSQNPVLNNVTIPLSGYYIATVTVPGCGTYKDSVNVTVLPKTFSTINQTICQGTTYAGYSTAGQYIDIFTGANGCDSTRTLNLTIKPKSFNSISQTICEGQSFEGYTTSGTFVNTFIAANGCDSVRTLNLTVKPKSLKTIIQSICEGQSFEGYTTSGTYINTFVAANGCDSIRTLILTVKPKSLKTITQSICQGQSFEGYTASGTYINTFVAANGCDSIRTLILTVKPKTFSTINQTICQGTTYAGYGIAGQYVDIFIGANGCDSTRTLNLTIKPKSFKTISQTICEGQSFEGYTTSGTFLNSFIAANGCDSVRTLNLTVKPKSLKTITQSICEGQSFEGYTTSGTYLNTFVAANGCDSVRTLNLTVKPKSLNTITQSICQGQSFEGYTTSGTYINTFIAVNGCDSIRTLNLTVKPKTFSTINQTICQGATYAGYGAAGQYIDIFTGANGCDSTRTLNLTIKPKSFNTISQTICEGQSFEGYTTSGTFVNTFIAANGCDSVRTLNLTVKPKSLKTITQSICEGQSFEGYTTSGTYLNTFVGANGCDSVRRLNLTVLKFPMPNLGPDVFVCFLNKFILSPGVFDFYTWQDGSTQNTFSVSKPGLYTVEVTNACGVARDSIIISNKSCEVFFPNVFTPNGDTKNDVFKILNATNLLEYKFVIYNRWGEKVFETNNFTIGWDGNYKGYACQIGSYVWYCNFIKEGRQKKMKGSVLLLR
jgi:gliding motility-associated-like protein